MSGSVLWRSGMRFCALLVMFCTPACAISQRTGDKGAWVFAYFKDPGSQGMYLALSRDGLHYTELNGGKPWMTPEQPGELFRDIFITRTPAGWRAVWTWDWRSDSIGTAESKDLLNWSAQRKVPIMGSHPDVLNTWAPETYWDAATKDWLVIWSSSFKPQADGTAGEGLRIWSSHTSDFVKFSEPARFYDHGFPVIDATLFQRGPKDVVMVIKPQTKEPLTYNEKWVAGPTVEGPWSEPSDVINAPWSEGPSVVRIGDRDVVFYDHYKEPGKIQYQAVATRDWKTWTDITDEISLPEKSKHGSFFRVTEAEAERLMRRR